MDRRFGRKGWLNTSYIWGKPESRAASASMGRPSQTVWIGGILEWTGIFQHIQNRKLIVWVAGVRGKLESAKINVFTRDTKQLNEEQLNYSMTTIAMGLPCWPHANQRHCYLECCMSTIYLHLTIGLNTYLSTDVRRLYSGLSGAVHMSIEFRRGSLFNTMDCSLVSITRGASCIQSVNA